MRRPSAVDRITLIHPHTPPELEGLTLLHLTDLHVRRSRGRFRWVERVVAEAEADLIVLTGDYMSKHGDEAAAMAVFRRIASRWRARIGAYGIFGNHDTMAIRRSLRADPSVVWIGEKPCEAPGLPLRLIGLNWPEDWVQAGLDEAVSTDAEDRASPAGERFRIVLAHHPGVMAGAVRLGAAITLAGHTHGGQIRLPGGRALYTSSELPRTMASGLFRMGDMLCCVSRGAGDAGLDLRINCPPQIPLYTLRRGPLPVAINNNNQGDDAFGLIERW